MANTMPESEEGQIWTNEMLLRMRRLLQYWRWDEVFLPGAVADAWSLPPLISSGRIRHLQGGLHQC